MTKKFVTRALCAVALVVGVVGGPVGAQAQVDPHTVSIVGKVPTITIESYSYLVPRHVRPGSKVMIVNNDGVYHTVTSRDDDGALFSVKVPPAGTKYFIAPSKHGTYKFYCVYHASMLGDLVVKKRR